MSRVPMGSDGGAWAMDPDTSSTTGFVPQGIGADLIATLERLDPRRRRRVRRESQHRAAKAWANGYFAARSSRSRTSTARPSSTTTS
jgi:acetyl-CoA C-acetyltransferase